MSKLKVKSLGKVAFAVGFGFYIGKAVGEIVENAFYGILTGVTQVSADYGSEFAQKICDGVGLEYKKEETNDDPENI